MSRRPYLFQTRLDIGTRVRWWGTVDSGDYGEVTDRITYPSNDIHYEITWGIGKAFRDSSSALEAYERQGWLQILDDPCL